jgi:hypothetical protein
MSIKNKDLKPAPGRLDFLNCSRHQFCQRKQAKEKSHPFGMTFPFLVVCTEKDNLKSIG